MRRRIAGLALLLAFLLSACGPAGPAPAEDMAPSVDSVLQTILTAYGLTDDQMDELRLDPEGLDDYLTGIYHLPEGSWDSCAVCRAGGAEAFEMAVLRLTPDADSGAVLAALEEYLLDRQGAFTGYAPDQAAIVADSSALLSNGELYAALLICDKQDTVREAFYDALAQSPDSTPSATTDPAVYAGRQRYVDPDIDDMTLYDTSAILSAWQSGDRSALSDKDAAMLEAAEQVMDQVITDGMSNYEKERAIYSWLTKTVVYDWDHYDPSVTVDPDSYNPYGPLAYGKGVCLGYATTFQLFMDLLDVECITVVGAAFRSREDHAWNMVRLDGEWYCVDATWDISSGGKIGWCSYFNVTSDYMAETDHQWDYANTPEATATDYGKP